MNIENPKYNNLENIEDSIQELICYNNYTKPSDFGEVIGYGFSEDVLDKLKETLEDIEGLENKIEKIDKLVHKEIDETEFLKSW